MKVNQRKERRKKWVCSHQWKSAIKEPVQYPEAESATCWGMTSCRPGPFTALGPGLQAAVHHHHPRQKVYPATGTSAPHLSGACSSSYNVLSCSKSFLKIQKAFMQYFWVFNKKWKYCIAVPWRRRQAALAFPKVTATAGCYHWRGGITSGWTSDSGKTWRRLQ